MPTSARNLEHWRMLARCAGVATAQLPDLEVRTRMLQAVLGYEWTRRDAESAESAILPNSAYRER